MKSNSHDLRDDKISFLFAGILYGAISIAFVLICLKNQLYLKILSLPFFAVVITTLTIGSFIHSLFSFKCMMDLKALQNEEDLLKLKVNFCKSMCINFIAPYILMIFFFLKFDIKMAVIAIALLIGASVSIYFSDLRMSFRKIFLQ